MKAETRGENGAAAIFAFIFQISTWILHGAEGFRVKAPRVKL
jgi:hypothetical protein